MDDIKNFHPFSKVILGQVESDHFHSDNTVKGTFQAMFHDSHTGIFKHFKPVFAGLITGVMFSVFSRGRVASQSRFIRDMLRTDYSNKQQSKMMFLKSGLLGGGIGLVISYWMTDLFSIIYRIDQGPYKYSYYRAVHAGLLAALAAGTLFHPTACFGAAYITLVQVAIIIGFLNNKPNQRFHRDDLFIQMPIQQQKLAEGLKRNQLILLSKNVQQMDPHYVAIKGFQ